MEEEIQNVATDDVRSLKSVQRRILSGRGKYLGIVVESSFFLHPGWRGLVGGGAFVPLFLRGFLCLQELFSCSNLPKLHCFQCNYIIFSSGFYLHEHVPL